MSWPSSTLEVDEISLGEHFLFANNPDRGRECHRATAFATLASDNTGSYLDQFLSGDCVPFF